MFPVVIVTVQLANTAYNSDLAHYVPSCDSYCTASYNYLPVPPGVSQSTEEPDADSFSHSSRDFLLN